MKLDFTIINNIDGLSIYAEKVFYRLVKIFKDGQYVFHINYKNSLIDSLKCTKISNPLLHRLKLGIFNKEFHYSPTHHGPIFNKNKILTIHDITPMLLKNKSFKQYIYYKYFLRISIKNTKKIITVSNFTKQKIIEHFDFSDRMDDIIVIHNATDIDETKEKRVENLPAKYLFLPGVHSEYKNYKRVIEAIEIINDKSLCLIITTNNDEVKNYCKNFLFVRVLSKLSYEEIKYLYESSKALVYPSLIEGFGFPALEAARLNKPIITTKNSSMQEFLGEDAAIYVNPLDVIEIKNAIETILQNDCSDIVHTAYENTKNLTWDKNVEKVVKVIQEAINE